MSMALGDSEYDPEMGLPEPVGDIQQIGFAPNSFVRTFWAGCKAGELLLRKCNECGTINAYYRNSCSNCMALDLKSVRASGKGTVYSFSVVYYAVSPRWEKDVPYTNGLIQLEEGVYVYGRIVDCEPSNVHIGMPVRVKFRNVTEQMAVPIWSADTKGQM